MVPRGGGRAPAGQAEGAHGQGGGVHGLREEFDRVSILRGRVRQEQPGE